MRRACAFLCLYLLTLDFASPLLAQEPEPDTTPPEFVSVLPQDGSLVSAAEVTLEGDVTGADALTVDGQPATLVGGHFVAGPYTLAEGARTWSLRATDAAGNEATRTHRIVRDATPPALTVSQPQPGAVRGASPIAVVGTAQDAHAVTVTVNGTAATLTGTSWVVPNVPLAEGETLLTVEARDAAGNVTSATRTVVLDTLPPAVAITDPAPGTVVPGGSIAVSGSVSDPHLDRVEVNGVRATVSNGTWTATVPLSEGNNDLVARAWDTLSWNAADTVAVLRDSQAPAIQIEQPEEGSWWSATAVAVSGTVEEEAGLTVTVNGGAATLTGDSFAASGVALTEGVNRLVARVVDRLGNQGAHTRIVYRDTVKPRFESSAPASGALALPLEASISLTFSEELRTPLAANSWRLETTSGQPLAAAAAVSGETVTINPQSVLPSRTDIRLVLTAGLVDRAGNALDEPPVLTFTTDDREAPPPPVLGTAPAGYVCGPRLALSGTAEADAVVEVTGGAGVATAGAGENGSFTLAVDLRPETLNRLEIVARDRDGNRSAPLAVEVVHDCTAPRVAGATLNGTVLTVSFSEKIKIETLTGATVQVSTADGPVPGDLAAAAGGTAATFTLTGGVPDDPVRLTVGTGVRDLAGNALAYPYSHVFDTTGTQTPSFLAGRVIDDETGRPLAGAVVTIVASGGTVNPEPQPEQTTAADGRFRLPAAQGTHLLLTARNGYTPSLRMTSVDAAEGADVFDPRLTPATAPVTLPASGGTFTGEGGLSLVIPSGALAASASVSVTALEEQGLPALLPYGWSPRGAAWVDLGGAELANPATLSLPVDAPNGTTLALVRLNVGNLQWDVVEVAQVAAGRVSIPVDAEGGWAAVEADTGATAPPAPVMGAVLGSAVAASSEALTAASLQFDPATVLASQRSVGTATYTLTAGSELPSGIPLTLVIREELTLLDGSVRRPGPYEADLVAYRAVSGGGGGLRSRFGLRPSIEAQSSPLRIGSEAVVVQRYADETVRGNVLGPQGGSVASPEGDQVTVPVGGLLEPTAVTLTRRAQPDLPRLVPDDTSFLGLLELDLSGRTLSAAAQLTLDLGAAPGAGEGLLFQSVDLGNGPLWRPVAALQATATGWTTAGLLDPSDPLYLPWPGVREGGVYLFAKLTTPVGFVRGTVFDVDGSPLAGAVISSASLDWLQISSGGTLNGRYVLPAPEGTHDLLAENRATGNVATAAVTMPQVESPAPRIDLDLYLHVSGPRVLGFTPVNGSTNVLTGIEPTITFSEPVDPSTAAAGILLYDGPTAVPVGLQVQGALVRVNPHVTLRPGATHELRVNTAVRDLQGNRLEQAATSTFVTLTPQLSNQFDLTRIHLLEPVDGIARVVARPGAVPGNSTVIVKRTTGNASTITGTAGQDGSFELSIPATLADTILLEVLREQQSSVVIELTPFLTADGRAAYLDEGVPATFTTLDGITVKIEAGTFLEPAVVRVAPVVPADLRVTVPADLPVVYAYSLDFGGAEAQKPLQVSVPTPAGVTGDDFLLSRLTPLLGHDYWMLYDLMRRQGARITTELLADELTALFGPQSVATLASASLQLPGEPQLLTAASRRERKQYLPGSAIPGTYLVMDNTTFLDFVAFPVAGSFAYFQQTGLDGWILTINSHIEQLLSFDAILIPTRQGQPYTLVGRDLSTGYKFFERTFDPAPSGGGVTVLPPDIFGDRQAPAPVSGSPLRFHLFVPGPAGVQELEPGITVETANGSGGQVSVTFRSDVDALPPDIQVRLLGLDDDVNVTARTGGTGAFNLFQTVTAGKRYLLAIGAVVRTDQALEIGFNEALKSSLAGIEVVDAQGKNVHPDVRPQGTSEAVRITPQPAWRAGATYRLRLKNDLADAAGNAWNRLLEIEMKVEKSDVLDTFEMPAVRDIARLGSLLFVAADSQGLVVLDASNPADLKNAVPGPVNVTFPLPLADPMRGLTIDPHGRVLLVGGGLTGFGQLKIFDPLAFDPAAIAASPNDLQVRYAAFKGTTLLSDRLVPDPGTTLLEGTPTRVSVLSDDKTDRWRIGIDAPPAGITVVPVEPAEMPAAGAEVTLTVSGADGVAGHPVTFRDVTRGRWHRVDAGADNSWQIQLRVRVGDRVELLRNRQTLAYVATSGIGVQVVDVDAFYNEDPGNPDPATLESDVLGAYTGHLDPSLALCGRPVADIGAATLDLGTLFDPGNPHPLTVVGLIGRSGLILLESDPDDVGDISFFNEMCLDIEGSADVAALQVLPDYPFDFDGDGLLEESETRDYILVAHRTKGLLIIDAQDRDNLELAGWVPLGGGHATRLSVDREQRRVYVSGAGAGIYVVDLDAIPSDRLVDLNQDGLDDRVIETIPLPGNTNAPVYLIPELGVAFAGGLDRGVTSVAVGRPLLSAITDVRGAQATAQQPLWRGVDRLAPLGVPTVPAAPGSPDLPASFRVLAALPGVAGSQVQLDVVSLGPGGLPVAGAGDLTGLPQPSLQGVTDGVVLRRMAENPWEDGYQLYLSEEITALADLRAARAYTRTTPESQTGQCRRCDRAALGIPDTAREILSGHQIAVRIPTALRTALGATYDARRLDGAEIALASTPWDLAPSVRQEPTLSPSLGAGDAVPGTLLHSGEMSLAATDLAVRGRGFDFAFTRFYRSQTLGRGPLGPGWDHGYNQRLRELPDGSVEFFDGRGRQELFQKRANGTLKAPAGRFVTLDRNAAGWLLIDAGHNIARFDRFGRLLSIADSVKDSADTGNEMTFAYDSASRLTRVTDTLGRGYLFSYDNKGRLEMLKDFTGREVTYDYDTTGRLISATSPKVETGASKFPDGLTTRYEYADATGPLAQALHARDNLTALRDPKNQERFRLTWTDADADGRAEEVTSQLWGAGTVQIAYDFTGRQTTVTDRRSHSTIYGHDAAGHPTRVQDAKNAVTTFIYDEEGLVVVMTEPLGRSTTYTYDTAVGRRSQANVKQIQVMADTRGANGSSATLTTTIDYETRSNQPIRIVDPSGAVTKITRDGVGLPRSIVRAHGTELASETGITYNAFGQPEEVTNPNDHKTHLAYFTDGASRGYLESITNDPGGLGITVRYRTDDRGNVIAVTDPRGVRSEQTLNELGLLVESRQAVTGAAGMPALGYKTVYLYDENGNLIEQRLPFGDGDTSTAQRFTYGTQDELLQAESEIEPGAMVALTTFDYDENLNMIRSVDPEGRATEISYDERDQASTIVRAPGTAEAVTERFAYELEGQHESFTDGRDNIWLSRYDGYGRLKETLDPLSNKTAVAYNDASLPIDVKRLDAQSVLLAESAATYDLLGRGTHDRQMLFTVGLPGSRPIERRVEYDRAGNPVRLIDPLNRETTLTYDRAERLIAFVDPMDNQTQLHLDAAGNTTRTTTIEQLPNGGATVVESRASFDALGRPAVFIDDLANTWRSFYDARGNVVTSIDAEGIATSYRYDGLDRLVHEARPQGIEITYGYDKTSRPVSYRDAKDQETLTAYDVLGRPSRVTYPDGTTKLFTFDATGNLKSIKDANGSIITHTFDPAGRMIGRMVQPGPNVSGSPSEAYQYDGLGRVTEIQVGGGAQTILRYDSLSRVFEEGVPGETVRYTYSDTGKVTGIEYPSGLKLALTFDDLDRPTAITPVSPPPSNLPGRAVAESVLPLVSYTYRGPSLLAGKTLANGVSGTWQYDAARRPVTTTFSSPLGQIYQEATSWNPRGLKIAQSRGDQNGTGFLLGYDDAGRLIQSARVPAPLASAPNNSRLDPGTLAQLPEGTGFTYDATQNLLARTIKQAGAAKTETMPLDASGRNRPASVNGKPLEWDANGNLIRKGDQRFQYDDRNRLVTVTTLSGEEQASYHYDSFNRRTDRTVGTETRQTVWSGWQAIEEYKNGALASRRTYGVGLDEIVQLENDLDGDGTPETSYAPLYDSTGNLVALTGTGGKPVERYLYDPYGKQTILVDSLPPVVEQVRVKGGALWLEISEEIDSAALTAAITAGQLTLTPTAGGDPIAVTATQPVQEGLQARRRVVLTPATVPAAGTSVELVIQPNALVDSFLNRPIAAFELTFDWSSGDAVLQDTVPPRVEQVLVREGHIEVELTEEPDLSAASTALQVNGQTVAWTLSADRYTLKSVPAYDPGTYPLSISTAALDLAGLGLAEAVQENVTVSSGVLLSVVSRRPEPRQISVSAAGNPFGFQGLPLDGETGFLYVRNRYYDPEMGRFISVDPKGYVDGPNPYGFAANDPVNGRDPLGLETLVQHTATSGEEIWDGLQLLRQLVLKEGMDPRPASRIVIEAGMGIDIGADKTAAMAPYIVAAGELSNRLILGSALTGLTGGLALEVAGAFGLGWFTTTVLEGAAGGFGWQFGQDLAAGELSSPGAYGESMAWGVGFGVALRGTVALASEVKALSQWGDELADAAMLGFRDGAIEATARMAPRITEQAIIRQRVLINIARSQSAREASGFAIHVERESLALAEKSLTAYWPPNNGFLVDPTRQFLLRGQLIDRMGGSDYSRFFSPVGTPVGARALPPEVARQARKVFEVMKPFEVEAGTVAPAFGELGLGVQYRTPVTLRILLRRGILREVR